MGAHELLAALTEARDDYAAARRAWSDLARIRSDRLGNGHWQVDEARKEADRLGRLAALPSARRRLIERAKGATAVLALAVRKPPEAVGSAFCIDPRGHFLAAAEAVNQGKPVRRSTEFQRDPIGGLIGQRTTIEQGGWVPLYVIVRAGRPDELALPATVVRVRDDLGLALLEVKPPKPLPSLELARRAPDEGAWACPLGYPLVPRTPRRSFGPRAPVPFPMSELLREPRSVPFLCADPTRVGSLRRHQGDPWWIVLETAASHQESAGLTGGPVLDADGRVLGMMVDGLVGTDTHYVIPVTRLAEFLQADVPGGILRGSILLASGAALLLIAVIVAAVWLRVRSNSPALGDSILAAFRRCRRAFEPSGRSHVYDSRPVSE
jgi:hypothetical protein